MINSIKSDLSKIATGTTLAFGGSVLGNAIAYLYGLIIARYLDAESVGLFFLGLVLMQFISAICRLGLPEGVLRYVAIYLGDEDLARAKGTILSAVYVVTVTGTLAGLLLFLGSEFIAANLFKQPALTIYLKWFAVALPVFTVFIILTIAIQAIKRMDLVVLARDVIQPITLLLLAVVLILFVWQSIDGFLAAYLGSMIVGLGTAIFLLRRTLPVLKQAIISIFEWKTLLAYSLPITISDLAFYLFRWSDTLLLSFFVSAAEIGIYNAALRTTLLLNLLAISVNALYAPIIANYYHHKRFHELNTILITIIRWSMMLALPIVLALIILADDILWLWGPEFVEGAIALSILSLSQLIFIIASILAFTLLMTGRQYLEVGNMVLVTVLNVLLNLALIPRYGITGTAFAMLISQVVALILRSIEVRRILDIHLWTIKYIRPIVAAFGTASVVFVLREYVVEIANSLILGIHLSTMVLTILAILIGYITLLYFLGFEEDDLLVWKEVRDRMTILSRTG